MFVLMCLADMDGYILFVLFNEHLDSGEVFVIRKVNLLVRQSRLYTYCSADKGDAFQ